MAVSVNVDAVEAVERLIRQQTWPLYKFLPYGETVLLCIKCELRAFSDEMRTSPQVSSVWIEDATRDFLLHGYRGPDLDALVELVTTYGRPVPGAIGFFYTTREDKFVDFEPVPFDQWPDW